MPSSNDASQEHQTLREAVAHAARGDAAAFEVLHARYDDALRRLLRRRGASSLQADEVVQHAWSEAWRALREGRYDPNRAAFSTFLFAIATNLWRAELRRTAKRPALDADLEVLFSADDPDCVEPDAALLAAERVDLVRGCLFATEGPNALSELERAVVLGMLDGETERALGKRLGVAASTVNARKAAGMAKIARCLQSKGFDDAGLSAGDASGNK